MESKQLNMKNKIKICCIGAGYVGGPTMAVIANKCPHIEVNVVDINKERIDLWNSKDLSQIPIYEPGLSEMISQNRGKNLFFSTEVETWIEKSDIIFIAVNTPTKTYGKGNGLAADLKYIELCARTIAKFSKTNKIIVEKSTLPVKTAEAIRVILESNSKGIKFDIISNPEFLAEGTAINDLLNADRVLIGGDESESGIKAVNIISSIYENWLPKERILLTNLWSSELSKLVANAFLAQRVSSINSISELCEATDANVDEVARAIGLDSRIGDKFLKSSVGFGGSCFQKDILNLVYIARSYGLKSVADYWEQVIILNDHQKSRFVEKIISSLYNTVSNKEITIYGWAFKKDTNDTRESPAIYIVDALLDEKAIINVYDPKVSREQILADINNLGTRTMEENERFLKVLDNPYAAAKNSHAIAVLTDWDEFINLNWKDIYADMSKPAFVFDGRRILDRKKLEEIGFINYKLGN